MLFAGWKVRMVKNCDRGLENAAQGLPNILINHQLQASLRLHSANFSKIQMKINPQDISNKLIKITSKPLSITFTYIDIQSIANCVVPNAFKISGVTPIHKSSETATDIGNYRPVTALSSFSKVLQRLTYDQLNSFLENKIK